MAASEGTVVPEHDPPSDAAGARDSRTTPEDAAEPDAEAADAVGYQPDAASHDFAVPEAPGTDEPTVNAALELLRTLQDRPAAEHVEIYAEVHRRLHDVLTDLDPDGGGDAAEERGGEA